MRFVLAFVAILVISWASNIEGGEFNEGSTGAKQTVKELSALFDSSRVVSPTPDEDDAEVVTATGAKTSVQKIIKSYELFRKSDQSEGALLPTVNQVQQVIDNGKKFDSDCELCKLGAGAGRHSEKPKKEWYEFLCF